MTRQDFRRLVAGVTRQLVDRALDGELARWLNDTFPANGTTFRDLAGARRDGVAQGWLCNREGGGIRYGRIFKARPETHGFSVDVVDMKNIAGPYHVHPHGEIDLIIPLTAGATFDGHPAGWCVYSPGSAHRPMVANGQALVLYLLPQGAIEFTTA